MKTKTLYLLLFAFGNGALAQSGELYDSRHTILVQGDSVTVYQSASFSLGSTGSCPSLASYYISQSNGEINLDVYYDTRGFWPTLGCGRTDTLVIDSLAAEQYTLIVNAYEIGDDSTFYVESDTSWFRILSLFPGPGQEQVKIYPNPAPSGIFSLELPDSFSGEGEIQLYTSWGQKVWEQKVHPGKNRITAGSLPAGVYVLHVKTGRESLCRLLIIE